MILLTVTFVNVIFAHGIVSGTDGECYTQPNGIDYRGNVSTAMGGKTCQRWTSQYPHTHTRTPANYPDAGLGDHNYCRNPNGRPRPWCHTTDSNVGVQWCDVGDPQSSCGLILGTDGECYTQPYGTDYRGNVSTTENGKTCQRWTSQYPYTHTRTPANYPDAGLGDHNYCRNPDGEPGPWCYTTSYARREYCDVGDPQSYCGTGGECYTQPNGTDYRGNVSTTENGKPCQRWTSKYPHNHTRTPANYPDAGLGDHNYCRNPDGEPGPWCYTTAGLPRWELCDVGDPQSSCVTYEASTTINDPTTERRISTISTTHYLRTTSAQTSQAPTTTQAPDELDQELEILFNEAVTTENVESVAATLTDLVANDTELSDQNLDNINEVLTNIVNVSSPNENVTRSVVSLVDDIIESYDDDYGSDGSVPEAPNQIQRALESQISTLQTQSGNIIIEEKNIAIHAVKVPVESVSDGRLAFDRVGGDKGSQLGEHSTMVSTGEAPRPDAEVAISFQLPQDILDGFPSNGSLPISFIVYQNDKLFPSFDIATRSKDTDKCRREVGGRIISATVETVHVIRLPTEKPVKLHFMINKEKDDKIENITCVFWDNKASNGLGDWSTEGCYQYQNQSEPVICHCSHLSSFSVLVDRFEISSYALDIISKFGCGVSIICLVLTLAAYLSNKKIRSKEQQQIFISFCSSLLSLYVVFLFGIERTSPQWGCVVVSILLHYFTLTTILWMAVEAFTLYVNIVKVVGVHISKFMLKASLVAWGVPAVAVAVIVIDDAEQYRNSHHCFITIGYPFYFTQVLLLMLTILFNGYIFIRVMYRLTYGRMQSSSTRDTSKASEMKKRAKRAFALSSLLGLTWVFGLLALIHEDATLTFQILFCVFNSLQGLFVFVMFCVLNHDIRAIWKEWCCRGSSDVPLYSSTGKTGSSNVPNHNKSEIATSQM